MIYLFDDVNVYDLDYGPMICLPPYINEKCDNYMPVLHFWNYTVK